MDVTRDGNIASARVGKLWLAAAGRRPIADDTWLQYLGHVATSVEIDGPFHGLLFWAPRHGPSATQRKLLTDELAGAARLDVQRRVALISGSALVRGTVTAINWFARDIFGAFAPPEVRRALDWLGGQRARPDHRNGLNRR